MPKVACTGNYISGRSTVLRCKKPCPDQPLAWHFASFIEFQEMLLIFMYAIHPQRLFDSRPNFVFLWSTYFLVNLFHRIIINIHSFTCQDTKRVYFVWDISKKLSTSKPPMRLPSLMLVVHQNLTLSFIFLLVAFYHFFYFKIFASFENSVLSILNCKIQSCNTWNLGYFDNFVCIFVIH